MAVEPPDNGIEEQLDPTIKEQLDRFRKSGMFRRSPVELPLLEHLLWQDATKRFEKGESGEAIVTDIYKNSLGRKKGNPGAAAKKTIHKLRPRLKDYYDRHSDDPVIISIPIGSFQPQVEYSGPKSDGLKRFRKTFHHYHFTKNTRKCLWVHKILKFDDEPKSGKLIARAPILLHWCPAKLF